MPHSQKLAGLRVLLADDAPDLCDLCQMMLESFGATVETTPDGEQAAQLFEDEARAGRRFDLVLLDYEMPKLNGIEATRRIRQSKPNVPVVLFTGNSSITAEQAGIPIWPKPMSQTELVEYIQQLLNLG